MAGQEKEGELATMSLEFEYLHQKSQCKMLIGRDDISSEAIHLWPVFLNVCLHSCFFPLHTDWWKSDRSVDGKPSWSHRPRKF